MPTPPPARLATGFALALYTLAALPPLALALLLIVGSSTWAGQLFGMAVVAALCAPLCLLFACYRSNRKPFLRAALASTTLALVALAGNWAIIEADDPRPSAAFRSVPDNGGLRLPTPARLVPEIDQLVLGTHLFHYLDPMIDSEQSARIRGLIRRQYLALREDPDFRSASGALGHCYRELAGLSANRPHLFVYEPPEAERPMPVILFVHGSLGNFKGYCWAWKALADRAGMALVAPTAGAGFFRDEGAAAIELALDHIHEHPQFDAGRVILAGVSNGGIVVSRALADRDTRFTGFIGISPVLRQYVADTEARPDGHPLLVLHGTDDRRIPADNVATRTRALRESGVDTTLVLYDDQDHFLFFDAGNDVLGQIERWMLKNGLLTD